MERLGDDARRLLAAAGAGGTFELSAVIAVWRDCVGEVIARAAWPARKLSNLARWRRNFPWRVNASRPADARDHWVRET